MPGAGGAPSTRPVVDQPDTASGSIGQTLPPPIPVIGKLIVKGKFDFSSVSDVSYCVFITCVHVMQLCGCYHVHVHVHVCRYN